MNTATSGYIQRRIVKLTEDIKIQYDGTVRDAVDSVYQLAYGEDGLDPKATVKVGDSQEPCDISSIVKKLNMKHENNEDKKEKERVNQKIKLEREAKKVQKSKKNQSSTKLLDEIFLNFEN